MSESQIVITLAFYNDGNVSRISELPSGVAPQAWFDHLSMAAADAYESLSGGRGVFRLSAEQLAVLKAPFAANHHPVA